jgi:signal transduction histidine kinase
MFISHEDLDVVVAVVAFAGVGGLAVAAMLGLRVSTASRRLLEAVEGVGTSGRYRPPAGALPGELAGLSAGLESAHQLLDQARDHERTLEASRRELVAWVSHDLRAPLAGLRAMAEALEDGVVTGEEETARYHRQIRRETDRLSLMIDDLFELSRIHAGTLKLSRRLVGLGDLIGEAITSAEPLARANGVVVNGAADGRLPVLVDPAQVGRALANLLVNAIQHTPPDGTVEILGEADDGMATVSVSDSCGGIPAGYLQRVFDVAFRGEPARPPGPGPGGGAGLGLSIARGIVEAHAGQIAVENVQATQRGQSHSGQSWPDQGQPGQGRSAQGRPGQSRPGQSQPGQGWPGQSLQESGPREQGCRFVIRLPLAGSPVPGPPVDGAAMVATVTRDARRPAPLAAPRRTRPSRPRTRSRR